MEPLRDDNDLATALRSLRPTPRREFAAELDTRANAGFPLRADLPRLRQPAAALTRIAERLRATPPRRILAPAGALAVIAIVVATAVVAVSEDGMKSPMTLFSDRSDPPPAPKPSAPGSNEGAGGVTSSNAHADTGPSGFEYSTTPPSTSGVESSAGAASARVRSPEATPPGSEPHALRAGNRAIERSAQIVLGTDPPDVRSDAAKVFDAVHAADGIVLRSSIRDGSAGEAGAEFELLIPSGKLGDALADFSAIGEVRSRREATQDITAPTVGVRERLQDSEARIDGLLAQLAAAASETERVAVEAELRAERRQAEALRSRLAALSRRANLSRVSLRIETGAASTGGESGGAWGVSDGLDDAGRILEIAAGVTIIGLAILAPLALIALLAWLIYRAWLRSARNRSLGQAM